jgi:uncharacterized protein
MRPTVITEDLVGVLREQFALDWHGIHGVPHWRRVSENGLRLAESVGARTDVVELFAYFHDARRMSEGQDFAHGERGARLAQSLAGSAFHLDPDGLDLLVAACRDHSRGLLNGDVTIQACWDADRLDLGRIGVRPRVELLCTPAARDPAILKWAYARSLG